MSHPFQSQQSPVSQATGTGTIVPAQGANARIRVMSLVLSGTSATPFNLQSHTTVANKMGSVALGSDPYVLPYHPDGWFVTNPGEALDLVVGGTAQTITGSINYVTL